MAVRIRLKKMGRTHRPFFRVCAFDQNSPRDGKALEELGTYDTSVPDTDARAILNGDRISYWLSVGAQPTEKVAVLIKKYGKDGTHLAQQQEALAKRAQPKVVPDPGAPASLPKKKVEESATGLPEATAEETKPAESAKQQSSASEESSAETSSAETDSATPGPDAPALEATTEELPPEPVAPEEAAAKE